MLRKPLTLFTSLPLIVFPSLTTSQKAVILLGIFFILDFITGILASWIEVKKTNSTTRKKYVIQSSKLRLSAVKFICYALGILCAWGIEIVFVIKKVPSGSISTQNLTFTTVVIAFFCVIEFYSIFFENIKRMGFDVIQKVKKISSEAWKLYKTIKNENNEIN
jgi:phage-related holin